MTARSDIDTGFRKDLEYIKEKVDLIEGRLERNYVTKDELLLVKQECLAKIESLDTVKKIVYGMVGLVLTGVIGALVSLVLTR